MKIQADFHASTQALLTALADFPEENFNLKPAAGGWSAAEVAEHLLLTAQALVALFSGPAEAAGRDPEAFAVPIRSMYLDFEKKQIAADGIQPAPGPKDKNRLSEKIAEASAAFENTLGRYDLNERCTLFSHPYFGEMTRIEWLHFAVFHTRRHTAQIERIRQTV